MYSTTLKKKAVELRKNGKTYIDIQRILKKRIPKGTLSYWCREINISDEIKATMHQRQLQKLDIAREASKKSKKLTRERYLKNLFVKNQHLASVLEKEDVSKIALAILYLGEGAKNPKRGYVMFGNSDPEVIRLFLHLFRRCYPVQEDKFRCTVLCRADQDTECLNKFWSKITGIPRKQFYKARIDPRTEGKPSRKKDYKGVCRIDYFSAHVLNELLQINLVMFGARSLAG